MCRKANIFQLLILSFLAFVGCDTAEHDPPDQPIQVTEFVEILEHLPPSQTRMPSVVVDPQISGHTSNLEITNRFTMTVVSSNDPTVSSGAIFEGNADITAQWAGRNHFRGSIVFHGIKQAWKYRNYLEFHLKDNRLTLQMLAVPVTYVANAHHCGDSWEEVYSTYLTAGGGTTDELTVEMTVKRRVVHFQNVNGCGAPSEGIYHHSITATIR